MYTMLSNEEKRRIDDLVCLYLKRFTDSFKRRHIRDVSNLSGAINLKKQNVFINKLPGELIYYSALVRSFDSSFGHVLEMLALEVARAKYKVSQKVTGEIDARQLDLISDILTNYRTHTYTPKTEHYAGYTAPAFSLHDAQHASDHVLYDKANDTYHIIELKAGGDLDTKKAEAEKRALLEQYFILKNNGESADIKLHFATAYNKFGEGNKWTQPNVEMFFASEELLIGKDFWNFVCKDETGFDTVIEAYNNNLFIIAETLEEIKRVYNI